MKNADSLREGQKEKQVQKQGRGARGEGRKAKGEGRKGEREKGKCRSRFPTGMTERKANAEADSLRE
jgi:hypothetical protein